MFGIDASTLAGSNFDTSETREWNVTIEIFGLIVLCEPQGSILVINGFNT